MSTSETQPLLAAELTEELLDVRARYAGQDKKLLSIQFDLEVLTRKQDTQAKKIEDSLAILIAASKKQHAEPPDPVLAPSRSWKLPQSLVRPPQGQETVPLPKIKPEAPRFNGENAMEWIRKIQRYFNHHYTPLKDRIYLTSYLFDHPASSWLTYWEDNCPEKGWDEFLLAVKHRFDPDVYVDYVGCLANLHQSSTVEIYQAEFEDLMQKASNVGEETLTSLFIAGLQDSLKLELLTKRPASLNEAFALAQQLAACQRLVNPRSAQPRQTWNDRDSKPRPNQTPALTIQQPRPAAAGPHPKPGIPIVKISAAERAERARKNLCYWCPEKYTREHVCSKKFYALMGVDDEDDESTELEIPTDEECETMVITGDVSAVNVIGPQLKPRSIRIKGIINEQEVSVLIDGGSTHNFIQPTVAEQLSLPIHPITPFRVFVGNGASLKCSFACLKTQIMLQGNSFDIDLFILQVKGSDVILGVQWLQDLGDVTKNFQTLTMQFKWDNKTIFLQGDGAEPRRISYNGLFSLIDHEPDCELFELISTEPAAGPPEPRASPLPTDPLISRVLESYDSIFSVPTSMPPARQWDHKIHIPEGTRPINVKL